MVELDAFVQRGQKIIHEVSNFKDKMFTQSDSFEKIIFPEKLFDENSKISVVLVGQYNAGKSSLLKMLTGNNDIAIGGKILTDKATSYDWNGIEIVDTPGIETNMNKDHDEITARAIAKADLLIFVITNELFEVIWVQNFVIWLLSREIRQMK